MGNKSKKERGENHRGMLNKEELLQRYGKAELIEYLNGIVDSEIKKSSPAQKTNMENAFRQ